jgi:hypothetical protein
VVILAQSAAACAALRKWKLEWVRFEYHSQTLWSLYPFDSNSSTEWYSSLI